MCDGAPGVAETPVEGVSSCRVGGILRTVTASRAPAAGGGG